MAVMVFFGGRVRSGAPRNETFPNSETFRPRIALPDDGARRNSGPPMTLGASTTQCRHVSIGERGRWVLPSLADSPSDCHRIGMVLKDVGGTESCERLCRAGFSRTLQLQLSRGAPDWLMAASSSILGHDRRVPDKGQRQRVFSKRSLTSKPWRSW
jgi:hypothetical protein